MHRRLMIAALACAPAARLWAQEDPAPPKPQRRISAAELHAALSSRFPVHFGPPGLLEVEVSAPRLNLLPSRQKLGATLLAEVTSPQLSRPESGEIDVLFALRYEPSDRTVRAYELEITDVRWPGLPPATGRTLQRLLPRITREAVGEIVLHRFSARDLALADTLGLQPEQITVTEDGIVVTLGPKPRS